MTAQIGDSFKYKGENYQIAAISEPIRFQPQDYGITPVAASTACWRGYWCEYEISERGIILENLYINSRDEYYPDINGVGPQKEDGKYFEYMDCHFYKNLNLVMDFTGKILLGKGFLRKYYIHMGYQRAWAYEVLKELVFEDGRLIETVDHSEMAKKIRKEIDGQSGSEDKNIEKFVTDSFSLRMEDKAWWIK